MARLLSGCGAAAPACWLRCCCCVAPSHEPDAPAWPACLVAARRQHRCACDCGALTAALAAAAAVVLLAVAPGVPLCLPQSPLRGPALLRPCRLYSAPMPSLPYVVLASVGFERCASACGADCLPSYLPPSPLPLISRSPCPISSPSLLLSPLLAVLSFPNSNHCCLLPSIGVGRRQAAAVRPIHMRPLPQPNRYPC